MMKQQTYGMGMSRHLKIWLMIGSVAGGLIAGDRAVAQLQPGAARETPAQPAVSARRMELLNWVGVPTGEDIAIMAMDFTPRLLPGMTGEELSRIHSAEEAEEPLGQLMLAVRQGNQLAIRESVKTIARPDSKDPAAQFLGGLWAESKEGDSIRAIEWFLRARELAEDDDDKTFIDRHILGSSGLADSDDEVARKVRIAAALRLADSFWNTGGGTARALAEILTDSGEAESASQVIAAAKGAGNVNENAAAARSTRSASINYREVVELLAAGDQQEALRIAVSGVQAAAASFAQSGSLDNINYRSRQMAQFVAAYGLSNAVLDKLNEAADVSNSASDRAKYAIAAEMLNKFDIALPAYRKLLADDPDQHGVRWRLIMNSIGSPAAGELLKEFPAASLQQFGSSLPNLLQQEQDFFRRLEVIELVLTLLDSAEPDSAGTLGWVANVLSPLSDSFYSDDVRMTGLHRTGGSYSYNNDAQRMRSEAAAEKRALLHDQVCESMSRHPSLAAQAFASISGFAGMEGRRTEAEFTALARALIEAPASPDQSFYYNHPSPSSSQVPRLTPAQYLFRQAIDSGSMTVIDEEIVPLAEKSGKVNLAASMKAFSALFSCEPEDFADVAAALVESGVAGMTPDTLIDYAQSAATQRQIDADLGPLVLSTILKVRDESSSVPYSARNYVTNIFSNRGPKAARAFINGVAELYLGPEEGQRAFVTTHYKSGYRQGEPSGLAYAFKQFLERFSSPMGVVLIATEKYIQCGYEAVGGGDSNMANRFQNRVRSSRFDDNYQTTYQMLDDSPWLKSVAEFDVMPMRYLSQGSCYGHLLQQMRQSSSSVRSRMLSHIRGKKPETFGKNLTLACFEKDAVAGVSRVAATHLDKIKALPVARQKELAAFFQKFSSEQRGQSPASSFTSTIQSWIAEVNAPPQTASARKGDNRRPEASDASGTTVDRAEIEPVPAIAQAFLDAQSPTEASSSVMLHQHVLPILIAVADKPDLCAKIFAHYRKLAAMPQRVRGGRSQGEDSYDSQLLAEFVSQLDPGRGAQGRSFAPLAAIFSSEAGRSVIPGQGLSSILASTFSGAQSDVTPGVAGLLAGKATPELDAAVALLLAVGAPMRRQSAFGIRLAGLSGVAAANGWENTGAILAGNDSGVVARLIGLDTAPIGLRLLAAGSAPVQSTEMIQATVKLAVLAFDQGAVLPAAALLPLLNAYIELGEQDGGPEWRATARRMLHGVVQSLNPGSLTPEVFIGLLEAAGQTGYSRKRVQLRFGQNFIRQPWFLAMLVKHGQFAEARRILRARLGQLQLPRVPAEAGAAQVMPTGNVNSRSTSTMRDGARRVTETYDTGEEVTYIEDQFGNRTIEGAAGANRGPVTFDDRLAAAIPEFLGTLPDPGLSALAELILLATPDANVKHARPPGDTVAGVNVQVTEQNDARTRVIAAAARIAEIKVDNPFVEERILSMLAPIALESDALRDRIAAYSRDVDVVALAMFEDDAIKQPRQRIFKAHLDAALVHRPDEFAAIMEALLTSRRSRDNRVIRALQFYGGDFPDVLFQSDDGFDQQRAEAYIPVFQRLLEAGGANSQWRKRFDCLNAAIVCHVLAGKTNEFTDWFATMDESLRGMFRSRVQLDRLLQLAAKPLGSGDAPEREIVAMLGSLMEAELFPEESTGDVREGEPTSRMSRTLQGGGNSLFESLIDDGVLSKEAILQHGPRWAGLNPRNGAAWKEIAVLQSTSGNRQEALESWLLAVNAVPWNDRKNYTEYHLEAARLLLTMDRLEPALTWFEFFNRGRLDEESELEFDTLFRDTRYNVMMRQGRSREILREALDSLRRDRGDTDAWRQLGSICDALARRKLAEGKPRDAVPMLEFALLVLTMTTAEDPDVGAGQLNEVFEALMEGREALGVLGDSVRLIAKKSEWKYSYPPGGARGNWAHPDFDDSGWSAGAAQLGYGDDDETTVLDWGDNPEDKPITAYFRKAFNVETLAGTRVLAVDLVRDDGAVVYLNGIEIRRDNLPEDDVVFSTEALTSPRKSEENQYRRVTVSPEHLREGRNVVAVEVHQNDRDSSDLSFDLQLKTNVLSLEETVRGVEIEQVKAALARGAENVVLEDWMWAELEAGRQPRERKVIILEGGISVDFDGFDVPPDVLQRLIESGVKGSEQKLRVPSVVPR